MTYEKMKAIFVKYGFITEELTMNDRVIYVRAPEIYVNAEEEWRNVVVTASFDGKEPILEELQFYTDFYLTNNGISASNLIRIDWIDKEITEAKVERKCKNMVKRLKILAERHKLKKLNMDF